jgi:hypothetical protein
MQILIFLHSTGFQRFLLPYIFSMLHPMIPEIHVGLEICALLGYNAASSGNPLLTFLDNVPVPSSRVKKSLFLDFLTLEDGTHTLSRNVGKGLPLDAALYPRRAQISTASRQKPEITCRSSRKASISNV